MECNLPIFAFKMGISWEKCKTYNSSYLLVIFKLLHAAYILSTLKWGVTITSLFHYNQKVVIL